MPGYGVFLEEIWQCLNGHSICSSCNQRVTNCPECRVPYGVKVRNRTLEELLDNEFKAECICGVMYGLKEVESHARSCVKGKNTDMELKMTKKYLRATKLEFGKMLRVPQSISDSIGLLNYERLWHSQQNEKQKVIPSVMKKLWGCRSAKKALISSLEHTLFSMSFSNP